MNHAGRVHVKYLKPIYPHEVKDRRAMGVLVRRRMLEALKICRQDLDKDISSVDMLIHMGVVLATIGGTAFSIKALLTHIMTPQQFVVGSTGVTVGLYVYYVYLINMWPFSTSAKSSQQAKKAGAIACKVYQHINMPLLAFLMLFYLD